MKPITKYIVITACFLVLCLLTVTVYRNWPRWKRMAAAEKNNLTWSEAQTLIKQCQVASVQPGGGGFGGTPGATIHHFVELKNGSLKIIADSPAFSEVERAIQDASSTCGGVMVLPISPIYVADFSDDKVLMGGSHNVFVGRVIRQIGSRERGIGPETQFDVYVLFNIKGGLWGTITVNQEGGYKDGILYVVEGGDRNGDTMGADSSGAADYLLKPGFTYLLATRYNPTYNWYTLNTFPTAKKLISDSGALSDAQLQTIAESDSRVKQLEATYPHEILLDADIEHNMTFNSYISTHTPPPPPPPSAPTSTPPAVPPPPAPAATSTATSTSSSTGM